jgi:hypothetical protein
MRAEPSVADWVILVAVLLAWGAMAVLAGCVPPRAIPCDEKCAGMWRPSACLRACAAEQDAAVPPMQDPSMRRVVCPSGAIVEYADGGIACRYSPEDG